MSGHRPFRDLKHKATPEQLAAARQALDELLTAWDEIRRLEPTALGLHGLYDCARLRRELGVSEKTALAIMRQVPKQTVPGVRKVHVRGTDVQAFLDDNLVRA